MIEVDPRLFIKCRLCLEDSGTYQIDPSIRLQICYCFDINIEPYDGLPQLICKKCQSILSEYAKTKRSFIGKQEELKKRIQGNNLQPNNNPERNFKPVTKKETLDLVGKHEMPDVDAKYEIKQPRISESSRSSLGSVHSHKSKNQIVTEEIIEKQDWKNEYRKTFVCRMCSSHWFSLEAAEKHMRKHRYLKSKHAGVLRDYCVVELPIIDDTPNITGSIEQVVISKDKIIAKGNADYYIAYIGKSYNNTSENENMNNNEELEDSDSSFLNIVTKKSQNENLNKNEDCNVEDSDSSSLNNVMKKSQRRKRRRICSRSSNETVVLENKSMAKSQENECIRIDDTDSDDVSNKKQKRNVTNKNSIKAKTAAVAKLIAMTHNRYLKKYEKPERPSLEQLKRKIISIGRQIINKRNFNSTRVMRYMEHLNLNVIWLSRSPLTITSNSNYFKIIPRLRYSNEKKNNDFAGYHKQYDKPIKLNKTIEATLVPNTSFANKPRVAGETSAVVKPIVVRKSVLVGATSLAEESRLAVDGNAVEKPSVVVTSKLLEESIAGRESTLVAAAASSVERQYTEAIHTVSIKANAKRGLNDSPGSNHVLFESGETMKKLLNSTPVANPRQLPKKFNSVAQKEKAKYANLPTLEINVNDLSEVTSSGFENNMQMPIITFTTSLAVSQDQNILNNDSSIDLVVDTVSSTPVNSISESPKPRIKVKSVTELMSTETLNRMNQPCAPQTLNEQMLQNGPASNVQSTNVMSGSPPASAYNCVNQPCTPQTLNEHMLQNGSASNVQSTNVMTISSPVYNCDDYVILDTVELPNTKTSSPFKYFRTLLQVHDLHLLDTDVTLSADFNALIKFKVLYKQDNKDQPVVLCLSLFCSNNTFCMKIKDRNEDHINITKISANWQWEILKIYRGDLTTKLLHNAQKISPEVREYTNRFLCLLKSLNRLS